MLLSIFSFMACSSSNIAAPMPVGLQVSLDVESEQMTVAYRIKGGGEPVVSSGVLGNDQVGVPSCELAATSAGNTRVTASSEGQTLIQVVGTTALSHPLAPNSDEFSEMTASVVQEKSRIAVTSLIEVTSFDPSTSQQFNTTNYEDNDVITSAEYYAVAADEYVVSFDLGDLWADFEEIDPANLTLMTKNAPLIGDVWASKNGNTLYVYSGTEVQTIGGEPRDVDIVEMYQTTNLQPDGGEIYEQCFQTGLSQQSTTNTSLDQFSHETVKLDSGCEGFFTHVKTGTQQWYNNVLVGESASLQRINIIDYGYEWYEQDPSDGSCLRKTAMTLTEPNEQAVRFVEYELTTISTETSLGSWSQSE